MKNRIAYENKLPLELANRLIGETEDELKADAEQLASLVRPSAAPPLKSTDISGGLTTTKADAGLMQLLGQLNAG